MKLAIMLALAACSFPVLAQDYVNFKQVNKTATDGLYFEDADKEKFVFSKERFKSQAEAIKFCADHSLPLADDVDVLVLGMAGSERNPAIAKAISFKVGGKNPVGGVIFWVKNPKEVTVAGKKFIADVAIIRDGGGMDADPANFNDLKPLLQKANLTGLPAVCGHFAEPMDSDGEDDSLDRDNTKDDGPSLKALQRSQSATGQ